VLVMRVTHTLYTRTAPAASPPSQPHPNADFPGTRNTANAQPASLTPMPSSQTLTVQKLSSRNPKEVSESLRYKKFLAADIGRFKKEAAKKVSSRKQKRISDSNSEQQRADQPSLPTCWPCRLNEWAENNRHSYQLHGYQLHGYSHFHDEKSSVVCSSYSKL